MTAAAIKEKPIAWMGFQFGGLGLDRKIGRNPRQCTFSKTSQFLGTRLGTPDLESAFYTSDWIRR
jgi:hypothetical protein